MPLPASDKPLMDALWQPRALIWAVMLVLAMALALVIAPGQAALPLIDQAMRFALLAFGTLWIAILVIATLYLCRRRLGGLPPRSLAWVALALMLLVTAGVSIGAWLAVPGVTDLALLPLVARNVIFAGLLGLFGMVAFDAFWTNRELLIQARYAELAALQARTRPHFLFNTLNAAIALVRQRPELVETLLLDLSDLLRAAVAAPQEWSLQEELDLTRKYLQIESLRFGERLRVGWDLPEPMPAARLPMLSLQPLVENAVLHGIERRPQGGQLDIAVSQGPEGLQLSVRNELAAQDAPLRIGHNIGLDAVRERVRQFTAGRGELRTAAADGWFLAELRLPAGAQPATTS